MQADQFTPEGHADDGFDSNAKGETIEGIIISWEDSHRGLL